MTAAATPERRTERRPARARREAHAPRHAYATRGAVAVAPERVPERVPAATPRPRPEPRPDHLRVVRPSERARRRLSPAMAGLLSAAIFVTMLAVAVSHTVLVEGQVRLDELDAQLVEEQARYQELRTEVAGLESPDRVVQAALAQGMVPPDDLVYLQPPAPDPSAVRPTTGDDDEAVADPTAGAGTAQPEQDRSWADIKALLEAPAP